MRHPSLKGQLALIFFAAIGIFGAITWIFSLQVSRFRVRVRVRVRLGLGLGLWLGLGLDIPA